MLPHRDSGREIIQVIFVFLHPIKWNTILICPITSDFNCEYLIRMMLAKFFLSQVILFDFEICILWGGVFRLCKYFISYQISTH